MIIIKPVDPNGIPFSVTIPLDEINDKRGGFGIKDGNNGFETLKMQVCEWAKSRFNKKPTIKHCRFSIQSEFNNGKQEDCFCVDGYLYSTNVSNDLAHKTLTELEKEIITGITQK